jgi:hypothetical protein
MHENVHFVFLGNVGFACMFCLWPFPEVFQVINSCQSLNPSHLLSVAELNIH